jgi:hypothetical protein
LIYQAEGVELFFKEDRAFEGTVKALSITLLLGLRSQARAIAIPVSLFPQKREQGNPSGPYGPKGEVKFPHMPAFLYIPWRVL